MTFLKVATLVAVMFAAPMAHAFVPVSPETSGTLSFSGPDVQEPEMLILAGWKEQKDNAKAWAKDKAAQIATKEGAKAAAKKAAKLAGKTLSKAATGGVGVAVDLAWPKRACAPSDASDC